jgi:hypothetical protein
MKSDVGAQAYQAVAIVLVVNLDADLQETPEDLQVRGAVQPKNRPIMRR